MDCTKSTFESLGEACSADLPRNTESQHNIGDQVILNNFKQITTVSYYNYRSKKIP